MRNYFLKYFALCFAVLMYGCNSKQNQKYLNDNIDTASENEHLVMPVLWHQNAAEVRALQYQAYNIAKLRLDNYLNNSNLNTNLKPAVIVDIDETILDNSFYQSKVIETNQHYPTGWQEWTELAGAKAIPGSAEFLNYSVSKGVEVFYVSNRDIKSKESTQKNLLNLGFPQISDGHLFFKEKDDIKDSIRSVLAMNYNIILLIGDNLNDFLKVFHGKSVDERFSNVDSLKEKFGDKFIVLPNAMYGEWEGAVYNYQYSLSESDKAQKRKVHLKSY